MKTLILLYLCLIPPLSVCSYWTQVEGLELKCLPRRSLFHFDFEKNCKSIDSIALRKWKYWYRWDWLWLPDSPSRSTPATSPRRPSFTKPTDPFCTAALSLSDSCQTKPVVFAYYCSCCEFVPAAHCHPCSVLNKSDCLTASIGPGLGKVSHKKNVYFWALSKLALPLPPIRATWSSFFRRQKRRIAHMTEKSTDDDDDGWNDNLWWWWW